MTALLAGCVAEDQSDVVEQAETADTTAAQPAVLRVAQAPSRAATADEIVQATARIQQIADSTDKMLRHVRNLSVIERVKLRRDANAVQIARARQLGLRQPVDLEAAIAQHKLVELPDSTEYWTLHNLNFSVPYVTPSTRAMLIEVAQRFQARLDSLNVPRFRLVITSALRTPDKQAALRRVNGNASRIESAHEFGTTLDIAYRRFAAPVDAAPIPADTVRKLADSVLVKTANLRSAELQAVLGRVIQQMKDEGKLMVMMERRQTVYHITVARSLVTPRGRVSEN
ncbi:MAG TPA: DUF5715 family protein [Longimicrobiales bacterium]